MIKYVRYKRSTDQIKCFRHHGHRDAYCSQNASIFEKTHMSINTLKYK